MKSTILLLLFSAILFACTSLSPVDEKMTSRSYQENTLRVGLYPYVPRPEQFKKVLIEEWDALRTGIALEIIVDDSVWDGGYKISPEGFDVYVFDALFLNQYRKEGFLQPLSPQDINPNGLDDFFPYAIDGVKNSDNQTYSGIPLLGCTNILFYKKSLNINSSSSFDDVKQAVKTCRYTGPVPGTGNRNGMMLDIAGSTTNGTFYIATQYAMYGQYPLPTPTSIDANVTQRLTELMEMSSYLNSTNGDYVPYQRGIWFGQGYGNSFVGFAEDMWGIAQGNRKKLPDDFSLMPLPLWNPGETNKPLFFADVIGVNPKGKNVNYAKKLAALLGSKDVVVKSTTGETEDGVPQYLLLTLKSAFDELAKSYPMYNQMKAIASNPDINIFTLSDELYEWMDINKVAIKNDIRQDFSCGCDKTTDVFLNTSNAARECTSICGDLGWNGQWTSARPYVPDTANGSCGCNVCEI